MKRTKIAEVTPFLFENNLLIAFSTDWIEKFSGIPKFSVFLDSNGTLHLESQKMPRNAN